MLLQGRKKPEPAASELRTRLTALRKHCHMPNCAPITQNAPESPLWGGERLMAIITFGQPCSVSWASATTERLPANRWPRPAGREGGVAHWSVLTEDPAKSCFQTLKKLEENGLLGPSSPVGRRACTRAHMHHEESRQMEGSRKALSGGREGAGGADRSLQAGEQLGLRELPGRWSSGQQATVAGGGEEDERLWWATEASALHPGFCRRDLGRGGT